MALPVVIAKNQTASPIFLSRLGISVPATPTPITLTDFASFYEISWEADLQTPVGNGNIIINDGTSDLSALAAIGYLDATGNLNGPTGAVAAGILLKTSGTTGRYTTTTGVSVDGSNNLTGVGTFNGVTVVATTLQNAYNGGNTVVTAGALPISFTLTSGGFVVNGTGQVDLGADATAQTLNFGTGGAVKTVTVGSATSTSATKIDSGTGNIDIGTTASARTINLGTGAAVVETINIGGTGANPIKIGDTQTAGSVSIGAAMTTGTINVGGTGAQTGTINVGVGTGAQAINLATGGTGAKTVITGSTASTSSLTEQTGTGAMTFTAGGVFDVNATGLLTLDSSGGAINIGNDAVAQAINVGTGAAARTITIGNTTGATAVNLTAGTGNTNVTSAFTLNGVISPTSLGASQNDYNPTSLSTASTIRQDASAAVNITGLAGGISGRIIILYNISSTFAITLVNESASSTAANRFTLPLNVRLAPSDSIILQYDGTTSRWRAPATSKGTVSGATKNRFYQFAANAATAKGDHNTVSVGANASINLEFQIPDDFTTLVSIQAVMIPNSTNATANIDLASDYAAIGETFNVNSESNTTNTYALTTQIMTGVDLSSVFTAIAAGDFCGVTVTQNAIGAAANYLGTLLRYT